MTPQKPDSADLQVGEIFAGRYEVLQLMGTGATASVYKVTDRLARETIALKLIKSAAAENAQLASNFKREITVARRISHPNVLRIFDIAEYRGQFYILMELVEGRTLQEMLTERGRLRVSDFLPIFRQLLDALAAAHRAGILHRDIKPANLMFDRSGVLKLMDFGIARFIGGEQSFSPAMGTPAYLSPEQLMGMPLTHGADIFSVAAMGFELLTGKLPYARASVAERCTMPPPKIRDLAPHVPVDLAAALERCLEPVRENRYQSIEELIAATKGIQAPANEPEPGPPPQAFQTALKEMQSSAPPPLREIMPVFVRIAKRLESIYAAGRVPAALTPETILMESGGTIEIETATDLNPQATVAIRDPKYYPPDAFAETSGQPAVPKEVSDLYSLGFIFYELVLGRRLFEREFSAMLSGQQSDFLWLRWHGDSDQKAAPAQELRADTPRALSDLLARMMEKDPSKRSKSMKEVLTVLQAVQRSMQDTQELETGTASTSAPVQKAPVQKTAAPPPAEKAPAHKTPTPRPAEPRVKEPTPIPLPPPVAKEPTPIPSPPPPVAKEPTPIPLPPPVAKEPTPIPAPPPVAKEPTPIPPPPPVAKEPTPIPPPPPPVAKEPTPIPAVVQPPPPVVEEPIAVRTPTPVPPPPPKIDQTPARPVVERTPLPPPPRKPLTEPAKPALPRLSTPVELPVSLPGLRNWKAGALAAAIVLIAGALYYSGGNNEAKQAPAGRSAPGKQPPAAKQPAVRYPQRIETQTGPMALIPGGDYVMGRVPDPLTQEKIDPMEMPVRTLRLEPFYIDVYEVTNAHYRAFCDATKRTYPANPAWDRRYFEKPDFPVMNVSWDDARAFAAWAKKRLPIEAEWEIAARGVDARLYPWGGSYTPGTANINGEAKQRTVAAGASPFDFSPFGVMDLGGNVPEWVDTDYKPYPGSTAKLPADKAGFKVVRGGSYDKPEAQAMATFRGAASPQLQPGVFSNIGFRCVTDPANGLRLRVTQQAN